MVFKQTNTGKEDEIPMPKIKEAINRNCSEAELLALFCGVADFKRAGDWEEESNTFDTINQV